MLSLCLLARVVCAVTPSASFGPDHLRVWALGERLHRPISPRFAPVRCVCARHLLTVTGGGTQTRIDRSSSQQVLDSLWSTLKILQPGLTESSFHHDDDFPDLLVFEAGWKKTLEKTATFKKHWIVLQVINN